MNRRSILISLITLFCLGLWSGVNAQTMILFQDTGVYYSPYVTNSGRLYFQSNVSQGYRIYVSEVDTIHWSYAEANPLRSELPAGYLLSGGPSLSADEDTLYFCAVLPGGKGDMDLWYSIKQNDGTWGTAQNLPGEINSDRYEGFPSVSPNGTLLFFTRQKGNDQTGSGCSDIYVAKRTANGSWSKPEKLNLNGNYGCVKAPRILADNKTFLFSSEYSDGKGGYEILKAVYENNVLNNIMPVEFINSEQQENGATLYNDREILIFVKNNKLYQYEVPYDKWLIKEIYLSANTFDKGTKELLRSDITLIDGISGLVLQKDSSKANHPFVYTLVPYVNYQLKITANGYRDTIVTLPYTQDPITKNQRLNILLSPKTKEYIFNITDAETNIGLDVDIIITDLDLNEKVTISSNGSRDGKYAVSLREGHRYDIEVASSQGYAYSRTQVTVPKSDDKTTITDIPNTDATDNASTQLTVPVTPLKTGRKLELQDIYFDYNSYTLSEASHPELDRVVELMKDNPDINIEIAAHTDNKGSADYNLKLSDKRAQEIVKYLVSKGVPSGKLKPKGYGAGKPVAPNDTEENRAKNRRVELKVISVKP